jgi:hypothetical protein
MLIFGAKIMENLLLHKRLALQMLILDAGGLQIRQNWDVCRAVTPWQPQINPSCGCRGTTALQLL